MEKDETWKKFLAVEDVPKVEIAKKEKSPEKKKRVKKFSAYDFLYQNPDVKFEFCGTKQGLRDEAIFEKYKVSTTMDEFISLVDEGRPKGHMDYDFNTGRLKIDDPSVEHPQNKSKEKPVKEKKVQKKSDEKVQKKSDEKVQKKKKKKVKKEEKKEEKVEKVEEVNAEQNVVDLDDVDDVEPIPETEDGNIEDEDKKWTLKFVDGVEYYINDSDNLLMDVDTGEQIGFLDDDGTIDYMGDGEEIHLKNKNK